MGVSAAVTMDTGIADAHIHCCLSIKWVDQGVVYPIRLSGLFSYPARLWNKGVRIIEVLLYWVGFENNCMYRLSMHVLSAYNSAIDPVSAYTNNPVSTVPVPINIPISMQLDHWITYQLVNTAAKDPSWSWEERGAKDGWEAANRQGETKRTVINRKLSCDMWQ